MMAEGDGEVKREVVDAGAGGRPVPRPARASGEARAVHPLQSDRHGAAVHQPGRGPLPSRTAAGRQAGPEMVPSPQGRDRLGTSMPTPMPMH